MVGSRCQAPPPLRSMRAMTRPGLHLLVWRCSIHQSEPGARLEWLLIKNGAPEEIRTPDPQIRSLDQSTDLARFFCKPSVKARTAYQCVTCSSANHNRLRAGLSPSKLGENWACLLNRCSTRGRPPPDPENDCPVSVATVTGAEVQKSVLRTTPKYRKSRAAVQSAALAAYDGQGRIGSVVERDGQHHAYTAT